MTAPTLASDFIAKITGIAASVQSGAGVGGLETAGVIVSYLAAHPAALDDFMARGLDAFPEQPWLHGQFGWTNIKGDLQLPDHARRARTIAALAQPKDPRS
jgi:hypothetical protein